jgi:hypothetical protein
MTRARRSQVPVWVLCSAAVVLVPLVAVIYLASRGPGKPVVVVYGDSLAVQSEDAAKQLQPDHGERAVFRVKGGTALCDAIPEAAMDRLWLHPARVVVAFTGNTATCARESFASGGAKAAIAFYEKTLRLLRTIYPVEPMTIVIPPAMHDRVGWYPLNGDPRLVAMYERVGAQLHMNINTDADTWLTPGHVFAQNRPDSVTGKSVEVRLSDGIHLTPAGARWYGAALLEKRTGDFERARSAAVDRG